MPFTEMRAPLSSLLFAAAAGIVLAGAGCASRPAASDRATEAADARACANDADPNPLHLTSVSESAASADAAQVDPAIQAILMQRPGDRWLERVNRSMYWSLRTLDAELRREQRVTACEHPEMTAGGAAGAPVGAAATPAGVALPPTAAGPSPRPAVWPIAPAGFPEPAQAPVAAVPSAAPATVQPSTIVASSDAAVSRTATLRKASLSTRAAGGGNGLTSQKVVPGSDNDIVARRLRKAAEQETNPTLRAKLWKEYTDYEHGASPK